MEPSPLLPLIFAPIQAKILYAAAELRIADLLADGPLTIQDLAERAQAHGPSMRRLLRALTGLGVVAPVEPGRYALTEIGRPLRRDAPDTIRGSILIHCSPATWRTWGEFVTTVRTGEPGWERAHGVPAFEFFSRHPDLYATFNAGMAEHTRDMAPAIVATIDFSRFGSVVDVGGGNGTFIAEILRAHPGMTGVLFDQPDGLTPRAAALSAPEVAERCRVIPGDFFEAVPRGSRRLCAQGRAPRLGRRTGGRHPAPLP